MRVHRINVPNQTFRFLIFNNVFPDQRAPVGVHWTGYTLFPYTHYDKE